MPAHRGKRRRRHFYFYFESLDWVPLESAQTKRIVKQAKALGVGQASKSSDASSGNFLHLLDGINVPSVIWRPQLDAILEWWATQRREDCEEDIQGKFYKRSSHESKHAPDLPWLPLAPVG